MEILGVGQPYRSNLWLLNHKVHSYWGKMEALDVFYPERMADRILEWDVVSLVERAQDQT